MTAAATTAVVKDVTQIAHRLSRLRGTPATSSLLAATSLTEFSAVASALPLSKLDAGDIVTVVCACSRARFDSKDVWRPAARLLSPRLADVDGRSVAAVASAFMAVRIRDEPMLAAIATRSSTLITDEEDLQVHSIVTLLEALSRFQFQDGHGVFASLEDWLARHAGLLSMGDIAKALSSLAQLSHPARALLPAARPRILEVAAELTRSAGSVDDVCAKAVGNHIETNRSTRHITMLLSAYARLSQRDEVALEALAGAISRPVPGEYLASLVKTLAVQLKPPPASLRKVVEASLPACASSLEVYDLAIIVPALPLIPGLRTSHNGLGQAVFGACLAAPLSRFRSRALVGVIRSALALGHADVDFWVLAMRQAERSIASDLREGTLRWSGDDLAGVCLLAARVLSDGGKDGARNPRQTRAPLHGALLRLGDPDAAAQATAPAAKKLVSSALDAARARYTELTPRALGLLSVALVKAKVDDGGLFALISHRASQLLSQNADTFGSRDVAQLLASFAHFRYRDEALLQDLSAIAEANMASYDNVAREIVLWSLSEFGGVPGNHQALQEALLEYELAHGRKSGRAQPHLESREVSPADPGHADFTERLPEEPVRRNSPAASPSRKGAGRPPGRRRVAASGDALP